MKHYLRTKINTKAEIKKVEDSQDVRVKAFRNSIKRIPVSSAKMSSIGNDEKLKSNGIDHDIEQYKADTKEYVHLISLN